jgi:hypothetical protein
MSTGEVHYKYFKKGYLFAIPISVGMGIVDITVGISYLAGYSIHRWLDNDSFMMSITVADGRLVNELPILGHVLFGIKSIGKSMFRKMHRKFRDHFPGVSTAIRLLFIMWLPLYFLNTWGIYVLSVTWLKVYLGLWMGLSHADAIHFWLDVRPEKS